MKFAQMMTKLAPLIGKEITERVFLTRFAEMCSDALFHVRKVTNFHATCFLLVNTLMAQTVMYI